VESVTGTRWILTFLLWAALDLSGPVLFLSIESFEDGEQAAHRTEVRRRERQLTVRSTPAEREARPAAIRPARAGLGAQVPRGSEMGRVLKLPPSGSGPGSAPDDH
jgi:hypothetical protein